MKIQQIKTASSEETFKLGKRLAPYLEPGNVITLEGDLGTGKTVFAKGIAEGLGVTEHVTSPTFTMIKEYNGSLPLYHMDVYRLEHSEEDLGFAEYFYGDGVTLVEWAQFIEDYLPAERLNIKLKYIDEHMRLITFKPLGNHYKRLLKKLLKALY